MHLGAAEALLVEYTSGRAAPCILSKEESVAVSGAMRRARARPSPDFATCVGRFEVRQIGRDFSRKGNGPLLHVIDRTSIEEAREEDRARLRAGLREALALLPVDSPQASALRNVFENSPE